MSPMPDRAAGSMPKPAALPDGGRREVCRLAGSDSGVEGAKPNAGDALRLVAGVVGADATLLPTPRQRCARMSR
jgi:hypothetical protein